MTDYSLLNKQLLALTEGVEEPISNLANASALLYQTLADLNWAGFYLYKNGVLLLGPFQGKTACTKIPMGKGVCGTAAEKGETLVVPDVHAFPGHIACDGASNSEIVIPLYVGGRLFGVLDIDSPVFNRFTEEDRVGLELFARTLETVLNG
ncbi:MAG: GAF domain-containing protein [Clostridia bacterium]|nr:GAF domain-containing protein [Clostridia bacterium]